MISILIPVYNTYVSELVSDLSQQLLQHKLEGEIIVFDDFSDNVYRIHNKSIEVLPFVYYKELDYNYGRIEIRKLLANFAKNNWLLFIDGDSSIVKPKYLLNFYNAIQNEVDVILGGRTYSINPPSECIRRLHWQYGRKRENVIGKDKGIVHSNNLCIKKALFQKLEFPEELTGYGHEDTWMGMQLEILKAKVFFIDNPVLHEGVESVDEFLSKSQNALLNLLVLKEYSDELLLKKHVRIYRAYLNLKWLQLDKLFYFLYLRGRKYALKNFHSCTPSLFIFDLYRLGYLIEEEKLMKKIRQRNYLNTF